MPTSRIALGALSVFLIVAAHGATTIQLTRVEYEDRVRAVWTAQIIAVLLAWPHEHQVASSVWLERFPKPYKAAPVDGDWYYEMCAVRAFERYGIGLNVQQLGQQWRENGCGSWGSSEQARLNLETPPVNESISELAKRTTAVGEKIIAANGGKIGADKISIPVRPPITPNVYTNNIVTGIRMTNVE